MKEYQETLNRPDLVQWLNRLQDVALNGKEPLIPVMDVVERPDAYELYFEVPGVQEKDVRISVNKGMLVVSGKRNRPLGTNGKKVLYSEFLFGEFKRILELPEDVDSQHISAHLSNGVLKVRLPKKEKVRQRKIEIN